MSQHNFRIRTRSVQLGDRLLPPMGANEAQGKPVRARAVIFFRGEGGEFVLILFLTEDSGVPPATTFAVPPTCLLYLPHHLLAGWIAALQVAPPTIAQINFDDPEATFVGQG